MRWASAKFIPKLLSDEQKQHRLQVAQEMNNRSENDLDVWNRIITGDESWVYGYDPETKAQSSQWKSPGSPRTKNWDKVGRMWRWWWWSFSILRISCIMNMPLGAGQSTRNTIKVSLSVYTKTFGWKSLHSGETGIRSSTMTTRRHIMHSPSLNFWPNSKFLWFYNPIFLRYCPCRLLPVSKITIFSEMTPIWQYWRHPGKYGEGS